MVFATRAAVFPDGGELASVRGLKNLKTEDKLEQILCPESKETIPLNNRTRLLDAVLFIPGQGLSVCFQGKVMLSPLDAPLVPAGEFLPPHPRRGQGLPLRTLAPGTTRQESSPLSERSLCSPVPASATLPSGSSESQQILQPDRAHAPSSALGHPTGRPCMGPAKQEPWQRSGVGGRRLWESDIWCCGKSSQASAST